ncbi:hypothetical protein CPB85DRAFT_1261157 [Mucidula mucida]|nr:hypothetical protein CPB85DRAFT_1261157 [Mucidula mucida]
MSQLNIANIMSLTGQVALVTGGGTGIGFMIAKGFATNGAKVYITGRREETLRAAAALLPLQINVTDQASIDQAAKYIQTTDGRLDILVNNYSHTLQCGCQRSASRNVSRFLFTKKKVANFAAGKDGFEHETFKGWDDVFSINTFAAFFMVRAFSDLLVKGAEARNSTASVINIGSVAAWRTGASKSAIEKVSVGVATDFARRKIPHPQDGDSTAGFIAPTPLERAGTEAEMVMTAMFLATCTYVTGASVAVHAGLALVNP